MWIKYAVLVLFIAMSTIDKIFDKEIDNEGNEIYKLDENLSKIVNRINTTIYYANFAYGFERLNMENEESNWSYIEFFINSNFAYFVRFLMRCFMIQYLLQNLQNVDHFDQN